MSETEKTISANGKFIKIDADTNTMLNAIFEILLKIEENTRK